MLKTTALSILLTLALTFGCKTVCVCSDDSGDHSTTAHQMDTHDSGDHTKNDPADHDHDSDAAGNHLECAMTSCSILTESGIEVGAIALKFAGNTQTNNNQLDLFSMIPPDPPPPRFS
mgnify:CR=1|jgi:hypothetical protein